MWGFMKIKGLKDQYTILPDLVYSQYFDKAMPIFPDNKLVQIQLYSPYNFNGSYMAQLRPPYDVFRAYKNGDIDEELFIQLYYERVLSHLSVDEVYNVLKGKVICCWETPNKFCHRSIVLEWINQAKGLGYVGGEV